METSQQVTPNNYNFKDNNVLSLKLHVPWGAIFSGVIISFGIEILLNFFGASIGLISFDMEDSMAKMTTAIFIWLLITNIIALGLAGWFTGKFSGTENKLKAGCLGLITWSIAAIIFTSVSSHSSKQIMANLNQMHNDNYTTQQTNITDKTKEVQPLLSFKHNNQNHINSKPEDKQNNETDAKETAVPQNMGKIALIGFIDFLVGAISCIIGAILGIRDDFRGSVK